MQVQVKRRMAEAGVTHSTKSVLYCPTTTLPNSPIINFGASIQQLHFHHNGDLESFFFLWRLVTALVMQTEKESSFGVFRRRGVRFGSSDYQQLIIRHKKEK